MAKNEADHPVVQVAIDGDKVKVICGCGWKSRAVKDETGARKLHDAHLKGA